MKTAYNTSIYRDWEKSQIDTKYPLFFIDAREKNDVLLLIEALIANAEVQFSI